MKVANLFGTWGKKAMSLFLENSQLPFMSFILQTETQKQVKLGLHFSHWNKNSLSHRLWFEKHFFFVLENTGCIFSVGSLFAASMIEGGLHE